MRGERIYICERHCISTGPGTCERHGHPLDPYDLAVGETLKEVVPRVDECVYGPGFDGTCLRGTYACSVAQPGNLHINCQFTIATPDAELDLKILEGMGTQGQYIAELDTMITEWIREHGYELPVHLDLTIKKMAEGQCCAEHPPEEPHDSA